RGQARIQHPGRKMDCRTLVRSVSRSAARFAARAGRLDPLRRRPATIGPRFAHRFRPPPPLVYLRSRNLPAPRTGTAGVSARRLQLTAQMKKVLRKGIKNITVEEAPDPAPIPHHVLIRPFFSLISSGTETASIHQEGVIKEVADNPSHIRKVLDVMKT